jgi:hypothetical protein
MFNTKILSVLALAGGVLVSGASFASEAEHCILQSHRVIQVWPYEVQQRAGRAPTTRLAGAQVFVEAGLTAEWLELTLARHIAEMRGPAGMKDCALDMKEVRVKVDPAGTGFSVKLIAKNLAHAQEVLRRARLLAK